jgi:crotonobetainyl-CoA:carnitine CoA-transferase CaiB-like acyl-CoA transferase
VVESEQLRAGGYFRELVHADGERVHYPGPFARLSATPTRYRRPAPRLGEHQQEALSAWREPRPQAEP